MDDRYIHQTNTFPRQGNLSQTWTGSLHGSIGSLKGLENFEGE